MRKAISAALLLVVLGASTACEPKRSTARVRELDLPRGYVDQPVSGTLPPGDILVAGWALAAGGIEDVSIYADGRYVDSAVLGFARPDVAASEPANKEAPTAGFQLLIPANKLPAGPVTLLVQVRARSGATRDLGVVPVVIQSAR
jgi:hypothetical protein